jgi:hypothetical protein
MMGRNYYTTTFLGEEIAAAEQQHTHGSRLFKDFYWSYHKYNPDKKKGGQHISYQQFEQSLATVRAFHLVLVTEWLNSASGEIDEVLGWKIPPKRVSKQAKSE